MVVDARVPPSGETSTPSLWLKSITRTGKVGGTQPSPPVVFYGKQMDNRVDGLEGLPAFVRYRLETIQTETGGTIGVRYSERECSAVKPVRLPSSRDRNTLRCYPVFWQKDGDTVPTLDWFHKYVAVQVDEQDRTGGQPPKKTTYRFVGSPAWAFDDNEYAKPEHRTWSQYRGYEKVETRVGTAPDPISVTATQYFRGMDGDRLADGSRRDVKLTDSDGDQVDDRREFQGMSRETLYYERDGGKLISTTLSTPWVHGPLATRARPGLDPLRAFVVQTSRVASKSLLSNGTWRRTAVEHAFNQEGITTQTSDLGDVADSDDDSCTRFEYARNATAWILTTPSRTEKVAVKCSTSPARPADLVSDVRMYYDGSGDLGAAPTRGNVTRIDELMEWPSVGGARFATTSTSKFDEYGRPIEATDVYGKGPRRRTRPRRMALSREY